MNSPLKMLGSGLLTLFIVGGVGGLLTMSLFAAPAKPAIAVTTAKADTAAIETVTVVGYRRAQ